MTLSQRPPSSRRARVTSQLAPLGALLIACMLIACSSAEARVDSALEAGDAAAALDVLEAEEAAALDGAPARRVRYCIDRGVAHLLSGDAPAAERWLRLARAELRRSPAAADGAGFARLEHAWAALGHADGDH